MKKTLSVIIIASMLIAVFSGCGFFQQQSFEMNSKELTLTVGDSKVISVVPESANKKLTWSSSDENIVTVEGIKNIKILEIKKIININTTY